ncbi:MAG: sigma-70 family RNA polymerase sigma factor [Phycisphaerae bacterium]|nr:sigma-70 family RNA polymerase sigma factor [Phycisphaerae bacterium]
MFALACRTIADRDLAADAVQEATRYWMGRFPGFVLAGEVRTFLHPVVRHSAIRIAEKHRRATGAGTPDPASGNAASQTAAAGDGGDLPRRIAEAVASLPEGQREAVHLRFAEGRSLAEIAVGLGVPVGTVKSRLSLAMRALAARSDLRDLW